MNKSLYENSSHLKELNSRDNLEKRKMRDKFFNPANF